MRRRFAWHGCVAVVVAVATALPFAAAHAQSAGETRQFRDWRVTCRADRYCAAETVDRSSSSLPPANLLRVARHAAQPQWEISVRTNAKQVNLQADPYLWVDDENDILEAPRDIARFGSPRDTYLIGEAAQRAMERFGPGKVVRFEFTDTEGAGHAAIFSLSGLTASLLWIDERQRRIGSPRSAGNPPLGLVQLRD